MHQTVICSRAYCASRLDLRNQQRHRIWHQWKKCKVMSLPALPIRIHPLCKYCYVLCDFLPEVWNGLQMLWTVLSLSLTHFFSFFLFHVFNKITPMFFKSGKMHFQFTIMDVFFSSSVTCLEAFRWKVFSFRSTTVMVEQQFKDNLSQKVFTPSTCILMAQTIDGISIAPYKYEGLLPLQ